MFVQNNIFHLGLKCLIIYIKKKFTLLYVHIKLSLIIKTTNFYCIIAKKRDGDIAVDNYYYKKIEATLESIHFQQDTYQMILDILVDT